jgi:hypothetical protein
MLSAPPADASLSTRASHQDKESIGMLGALRGWLRRNYLPNRTSRHPARRVWLALESLETREVLSATTTPTYLLTSGKLYQETAWGKTLVDSGVRSFAVAPSRRLYVLQTNGILLGSNNGSAGELQQLATGVAQLSVATSGSVYALQSNGLLMMSTTGLPGSFRLSDRLVYAIKTATSGSVVVTDWFSQHLTDPGLAALARHEFTTDDAIGRGDMLALFTEAETNTISAAELQSLRAIASNPVLLHVPSYVHNLESKTVYTNPADAIYQGHALPALMAGSSAVVLEDLVNKWFLGLDHPVAGGRYSAVSGTLFGQAGPKYSDVDQGGLGDCWLLASLAETAFRSPSVIKSMFIANGDGTWSVRLYHNGVPDWVTVDDQLPGGGTINDKPQNGVLWVALAEKAFAQQSASGWLGTSAMGHNAYNALNGGNPAVALSALMGRNAQDNDVSDSAIAACWKQGQLLVLLTVTQPPDKSIVGYHAYAVLSYNAATDTYTLFNPWGVAGAAGGKTFYPGFVTVTGRQLAANFDAYSSD